MDHFISRVAFIAHMVFRKRVLGRCRPCKGGATVIHEDLHLVLIFILTPGTVCLIIFLALWYFSYCACDVF